MGEKVANYEIVREEPRGIGVRFKSAEDAGTAAAALVLQGIDGKRVAVTKDHYVSVTGMSGGEFESMYGRSGAVNSFRAYARAAQAALGAPDLRVSNKKGIILVSFPQENKGRGGYKLLRHEMREYGIDVVSKTVKDTSSGHTVEREALEITPMSGKDILAMLDEIVNARSAAHVRAAASESSPLSRIHRNEPRGPHSLG